MTKTSPPTALMLALALLTTFAADSLAWNPWDDIVRPVVTKTVDTITTVGNTVGGTVGAPFGGFIGAAAKPIIDDLEAAGTRLIGQVDQVMAKNLQNLDAIADKRIGDLDLRLERRIAQIDDVMKQNIDKVDEVMKTRIGQVDTLIALSIADLDGRIKQRLDQVDEIAYTRIGTLDVTATKAALTFEAMALRVLGMGCVVGFLAAALWVIYREISKDPDLFASGVRPFIRQRWRTIAAHVAVAAGIVIGLYGAVHLLPGGPQRRAKQIATAEELAYSSSLAALDFQQARFHAAQLTALDATDAKYRAAFLKSELLRDLFSRPAMTGTLAGLNGVILRISQIEDLEASEDPDLDAVKAFVLWQSGATREAERQAYDLCRHALLSSTGFALRPLALNYVQNYLHRPVNSFVDPEVDDGSLSADHEKYGKPDIDDKRITSLTYMSRYNRYVMELDDVAGPAYLNMVRQHAMYLSAKRLGDQNVAAKALAERGAASKNVLIAWDKFVGKLTADPLIAESPAALAAFLLNDAVYLRALWYHQDADGARTPSGEGDDRVPPLLQTSTQFGNGELERIPRVVLAKRYLSIISPSTRDLIDSEEYRRFRAYEASLRTFELAMARLIAAQNQDGWKKHATSEVVVGALKDTAVAAAAAGLYQGPTPVAQVLEKEARDIGPEFSNLGKGMRESIAEAYMDRSLKLL